MADGTKGYSSLALWVGDETINSRAMGSTPNGTRDLIRIGQLWLPWSGEDIGTTTYDVHVWTEGTAAAAATPAPTPSALSGTTGGVGYRTRTTPARLIS